MVRTDEFETHISDQFLQAHLYVAVAEPENECDPEAPEELNSTVAVLEVPSPPLTVTLAEADVSPSLARSL